ncbi:hypothetical protein TNCT_449731 [Trichonephila clavata]|uniref:Uncharacterized protein n=1 Tax=Trichonephila clavata TaxID=2740835 RepID=A0A8X6HN99_TRICU|nr:hypothetical protein TNCT_449731 [Trichonephila clavata]
MPIIVPCIEEETGIVQEAEIVQGEDSFNLPETSQPTPTTSRRQTPDSKKRKRAREELIDAALMKIGGETDQKIIYSSFALKALKNIQRKPKMKH